jgi:putative Ca2+/H+ antiporter (TMEM165/GDT1 family)
MPVSHFSRTFFALGIVAVVAASVADDWFKTLDSNQDGFLDKTEYDEGLVKMHAFLHQPLAISGSPSFLSLPEFSFGGFWNAFTSSVAMIIATEIGDKTFFIAAVLSMKHSRSAVFFGAILALIVMTVLSTAMGMMLPNFIPKEYTHLLGGLLFLYFGCKLIYDSRQMEAGKTSEELEEVEEELLQQGKKKADLEEGSRSNRPPSKKQMGWNQVVIQSLTLTFVAEWGDRSQIATIALAASKNPIGVTIGGCVGHSLCTGLAVVGGRMLAARISEKTVSLLGGLIFLIFGIHSFFFES